MAECDPDVGKATAKAFVLLDVPELEDKENYLINYLESVLGGNVATVCFHPEVPNRTLFTMKEQINIDKVMNMIAEHSLDSHILRVEPANLKSVVIANYGGLLQQATKSLVNEFFQCDISDIDEASSNCVQIPHSARLAVSLEDFEGLQKILESGGHHISLPREEYEIQVKPFYSNFHGCIPHPDPDPDPHKDTILYHLDLSQCTHKNKEKKTSEATCAPDTFHTNKNGTGTSSDGNKDDESRKNNSSSLSMTKRPPDADGTLRENEEETSLQKAIRPSELKDNGLGRKTTSFKLPELYYNYMLNYCQKDFFEALGSVESSVSRKKDTITIDLSGNESAVKSAREDLKIICGSIRVDVIDLSKEFDGTKSKFVIEMMSSPREHSSFFFTQRKFEHENNCCIVSDDGENSRNQEITFELSSLTELTIKSYGNITEEPSDILVCVLPKDKKLGKTNIGKAFITLNPQLEEIVQEMPFISPNVAFHRQSVAGSTCKGVLFVILSQDLKAKQFQEIIQELLLHVNQYSSIHSVAFPPLGHGIVMKYSIEFIAKNFFSALKRFVKNAKETALRKITYLATNGDLYLKMKEEGEKLFQLVPQDARGSGTEDSCIQVKEDKNNKGNADIRIMHRNEYSLAGRWKKKLEAEYIKKGGVAKV